MLLTGAIIFFISFKPIQKAEDGHQQSKYKLTLIILEI